MNMSNRGPLRGAKALSRARENDYAEVGVVREPVERLLEASVQGVVDGVALIGTIHGANRNPVVDLDLEMVFVVEASV